MNDIFPFFAMAMVLLVSAIIICVMRWLSHRRERCPYCGCRSFESITPDRPGLRLCAQCGQVFT
jgi:hypothetical protein